MKTALKVLAWTMLVSLVVAIGLVAAGATWLLPLDHGVITIDGDTITLGALHGTDWLVALLLVVAAVLIVVLIVPIAVLVPLLAAALGLGVALLAMLGAAALVMSPLLLLVWIIWRLARAEKPRGAGGATMGA
jgi:hypothetical protein